MTIFILFFVFVCILVLIFKEGEKENEIPENKNFWLYQRSPEPSWAECVRDAKNQMVAIQKVQKMTPDERESYFMYINHRLGKQ